MKYLNFDIDFNKVEVNSIKFLYDLILSVIFLS